MEKTVIPKMKHNDVDHLNAVSAMTAAELDELVRSGRYGITILTNLQGVDTTERVLPGEWKLCFISSRGKPGVDRPTTRVVISHTDKRTGAIYREGMQSYAEESGLTPDHAFNWRNIFNSSRFRLLEALVEMQNNADLRVYLKGMPPMINSHPNIQWLRAMPTTAPSVLDLSPAELNQLLYLTDEVLRPRYTFEDLHYLRENSKAAKAASKGETYTVKPYVERPPRTGGDKPAYNKPRFDKKPEQRSEEQHKPKRVITHNANDDDGFPAIKPDHERRQRRRNGDRLRDKDDRRVPRWR